LTAGTDLTRAGPAAMQAEPLTFDERMPPVVHVLGYLAAGRLANDQHARVQAAAGLSV